MVWLKRQHNSLHQLRKKAGLTQVELARRAGVNHTTIVHAETGRKHPQLAILLKIVAVLDEELSRQGIRVTLDNFADLMVKEHHQTLSLNNGLYDLRKRSGLTIKELAQRAGVSTVTVRNAETGKSHTYRHTL